VIDLPERALRDPRPPLSHSLRPQRRPRRVAFHPRAPAESLASRTKRKLGIGQIGGSSTLGIGRSRGFPCSSRASSSLQARSPKNRERAAILRADMLQSAKILTWIKTTPEFRVTGEVPSKRRSTVRMVSGSETGALPAERCASRALCRADG
jgi:hypothetical protein